MKLTEQQVRQVIREEIQEYLLEEGIMDLRTGPFRKLFLPAVAVATFLNAVQTQGEASADSPPPIQQQVESIEQLVDEAGMTDKVLSELNNGLEEEDIPKLESIFQQVKEKQQEINDARKSGATEDKIKELETEKSNIFSGKNISDPEQLQRILDTGGVILRYIEEANPGELSSLGDINQKGGLLKLKAKALSFALSKKGKSQLLANNVTQDLIDAKNYVLEKDPSIPQTIDSGSFFKIILAYILGNYGNEAAEQFGDVITPIELIKFLKDNEQFKSSLYKNFKPELIDEYNAGLEDNPDLSISKDEAFKIMSRVSKQSVQENKIDKLRQRLNELRGVYV